MEVIKFNGLDQLASPVDQAKMAGLLKGPEQLSAEMKNKYWHKGVIIGVLVTASVFVVMIGFAYYITRPEKKEES